MHAVDERVRLRTGDEVVVRPLVADDRERLAAAVAGLSSESRYRRFHSGFSTLSEQMLDRLLDVDHENTEAIVALTPDGREIVAGARFTRYPAEPATADLAVSVADGWQRHGLATLLLGRLAQRAAEVGVRRFTAVILADNRPTLELVQRLGPVEFVQQGTTVAATMTIGAWPAADAGPAPTGAAPRRRPGLPELVRTVLLPVDALLRRFSRMR